MPSVVDALLAQADGQDVAVAVEDAERLAVLEDPRPVGLERVARM